MNDKISVRATLAVNTLWEGKPEGPSLEQTFTAFARFERDIIVSQPILGEGMVLVPREPTEEWAYAVATFRQGQRDDPRCESPSGYDIGVAKKIISNALGGAAKLAAAPSSSAPNSPAIPAGMKPWHGGDSAPEDYTDRDVLLRNGRRFCGMPLDDLRWAHTGGPEHRGEDIIAYTPKPASDSPATPAMDASRRAETRFAENHPEQAARIEHVLSMYSFSTPSDRARAYEVARIIKSAPDDAKVFDRKPDLGADTLEPSLHQIIFAYYLRHFPVRKAGDLTNGYIAALQAARTGDGA